MGSRMFSCMVRTHTNNVDLSIERLSNDDYLPDIPLDGRANCTVREGEQTYYVSGDDGKYTVAKLEDEVVVVDEWSVAAGVSCECTQFEHTDYCHHCRAVWRAVAESHIRERHLVDSEHANYRDVLGVEGLGVVLLTDYFADDERSEVRAVEYSYFGDDVQPEFGSKIIVSRDPEGDISVSRETTSGGSNVYAEEFDSVVGEFMRNDVKLALANGAEVGESSTLTVRDGYGTGMFDVWRYNFIYSEVRSHVKEIISELSEGDSDE